MQCIDKRLIWKIQSLVVDTGVRRVDELKRHLEVYVKTLFSTGETPQRDNRRFYPTVTDIRNHKDAALVSMQ